MSAPWDGGWEELVHVGPETTNMIFFSDPTRTSPFMFKKQLITFILCRPAYLDFCLITNYFESISILF